VSYIPDVTDSARPFDSDDASLGAAELRLIKAKLNTTANLLNSAIVNPVSTPTLDALAASTGASLIGGGGQVVDSITALRALLKTSPSKHALTTGYYAAGDGGSSTYWYDASDTTSLDNGGTVIVATDGGRWKLWRDQVVSIKQFGAKGDDATNDTAAFNAAFAAGVRLYGPAGTYKCNAIATSRVIFQGDGSHSTFIKPFSTATAAITYRFQDGSWYYHSEFRDVSFISSGKVGIGFAFGQSIIANYSAGDEQCRMVKFYGCYFAGFNKGVYFPYGNISSEFYSCGFAGNYYGVYALNNKFGSGMHAGNKYFFGGAFDSNTCGVYIHNTITGFGGVVFDGTTFEFNNIDSYIYSNNTNEGVSFNDCWAEGSGVFVSAAQVSLDQWAGTVLTTALFDPHARIFDGTKSDYAFNGGFVTDINVIASDTRVTVNNAHVERSPGYGGYPCIVTGNNSAIYVVNPETDGGLPYGNKIYTKGNVKFTNYDITDGNSFRGFFTQHRYNKLAGSYGGSGAVVNLTAGSNLGNGTFNVAAGTTGDGVIYATCNTYSIPFTTAGNSTALIAGTVALAASTWYVVTCNIKITSGDITKFLLAGWDRGGNILYNIPIPALNTWYTFAAIGYSPNVVATFYALDFYATATAVNTVAARASAFQVRGFSTQEEAQAFLESSVYVGP